MLLSEWAPQLAAPAALKAADACNVGQVAMVTGSAGGIGREVTKQLLQRGMTVVTVTRTAAQAEELAWALRKFQTEGAKVIPLVCDLSDLVQVKAAAQRFLSSGSPLHLLVNVAGVAHWDGYVETDAGLEMNFATNHLGPFLLTQEVMKCLHRTAQDQRLPQGTCRVINVSSAAHRWCRRPWSLLAALHPADGGAILKAIQPWEMYGFCKLANILHARSLGAAQRAHQDDSREVIALAVHPGIAPTGLQRHMGHGGKVLNAVSQAAGFSAERAASRVLLAALCLDFNDAQGAYIADNKTVLGSRFSRDEELQRALWELSLGCISAIATLDENCDYEKVI